MLDDVELAEDVLTALPIFPLPNVVLLPGIVLPLNVFEPRYVDLVDHVIAQISHRTHGERTEPLRRPLWHARAELRLFRRTLRSIARGHRGRREPFDREALLGESPDAP